MATKFRVWNVWGYSNGNMRHVATYHYCDRQHAEAFAAITPGGYILPSNVAVEPDRETHALTAVMTG